MTSNWLLLGADPTPTAILPDGTYIYLPDKFGSFVITSVPVDDEVTNDLTGQIFTRRLGVRINASIQYNHVNTAIWAGVEIPGFRAFTMLQAASSFQFSQTGRDPFIEMRAVGALDFTRIQAHVPEGVKANFESLHLWRDMGQLVELWKS